ncbi:MAG: excinuclease ABC subunit C [Denitrovibrio sp.]|nr:MAG: excinuclease ABC subunit C [Denitrovibrio sp.]
MVKNGYVYIITNRTGSVLYTGVTSNLIKRIYEHKNKLIDGFSKKYSLEVLVYYECFDDIALAITREKQIKSGSRKSKLLLINGLNREWRDLYIDICN